MKVLKLGVFHGMLILCLGVLPIAGAAAVDNLHHPGGGHIDCDPGSMGEPVDCDTEVCTGAAASCGSHHGYSMIVAVFSYPFTALSGGAGAARVKDDFDPPPPSRIDRPPIA